MVSGRGKPEGMKIAASKGSTPWAGILRAARPCRRGVSGTVSLTARSKGSQAFGQGSRGRKPLGRTTSGGESRDSKGRLWSPFSAEHRLRCITALFVSFSLRPALWPWRSQTVSGKLGLLALFIPTNVAIVKLVFHFATHSRTLTDKCWKLAA